MIVYVVSLVIYGQNSPSLFLSFLMDEIHSLLAISIDFEYFEKNSRMFLKSYTLWKIVRKLPWTASP
jgi:hypothetical protein